MKWVLVVGTRLVGGPRSKAALTSAAKVTRIRSTYLVHLSLGRRRWARRRGGRLGCPRARVRHRDRAVWPHLERARPDRRLSTRPAPPAPCRGEARRSP